MTAASNRAARLMLSAGALNALLAVAAGAYGAHALPDTGVGTYSTAVLYHLFHALGLVAVGILLRWRAEALLIGAGALMLAGIALFCGSLYALALTGYRSGAAPFGGAAFMAAWLLFAVAVGRR